MSTTDAGGRGSGSKRPDERGWQGALRLGRRPGTAPPGCPPAPPQGPQFGLGSVTSGDKSLLPPPPAIMYRFPRRLPKTLRPSERRGARHGEGARGLCSPALRPPRGPPPGSRFQTRPGPTERGRSSEHAPSRRGGPRGPRSPQAARTAVDAGWAEGEGTGAAGMRKKTPEACKRLPSQLPRLPLPPARAGRCNIPPSVFLTTTCPPTRHTHTVLSHPSGGSPVCKGVAGRSWREGEACEFLTLFL